MKSERASLRSLARVASEEFSSLLGGDPILLPDRLRLVLVDHNWASASSRLLVVE